MPPTSWSVTTTSPCSPTPSHLLVEEAFRSNAGIVTPKVVSWDDPERLIHVGMTVDKGGSVVDRVQPNEIDHGQHDAVRDVFVAPGGATLVRADLFDELGGFDPAIVAMGEDLDLCWRAQVVGARIIVAPDARVRHREELAAGSRSIDPCAGRPGWVTGRRPAGDPPGAAAPPRAAGRPQVLRDGSTSSGSSPRCWSWPSARSSWPRWPATGPGPGPWCGRGAGTSAGSAVIRGQRKELKAHRRLADKEIRLLQIGGSARLSTYGRRVFQYGFHGAHADELAAADAAGRGRHRVDGPGDEAPSRPAVRDAGPGPGQRAGPD